MWISMRVHKCIYDFGYVFKWIADDFYTNANKIKLKRIVKVQEREQELLREYSYYLRDINALPMILL